MAGVLFFTGAENWGTVKSATCGFGNFSIFYLISDIHSYAAKAFEGINSVLFLATTGGGAGTIGMGRSNVGNTVGCFRTNLAAMQVQTPNSPRAVV